MKLNPYSSPSTRPVANVSNQCGGQEVSNRGLSSLFLLATGTGSIAYTLTDEVLIGTGIGAWPMLFTTALIALACSFLTRDWLIAPLCCFCGTVSGSIVAGLFRGWGYARMEICIPVALALSIPSLLVAAILFNQKQMEIQGA